MEQGHAAGTVTALMMGAIALSILEAIMLRRVTKPPAACPVLRLHHRGPHRAAACFNIIYA